MIGEMCREHGPLTETCPGSFSAHDCLYSNLHAALFDVIYPPIIYVYKLI